METNREKFADIVKEVSGFECSGTISADRVKYIVSNMSRRFEAAHRRDIESYKRLLQTSQAALEVELVNVAELRECLRTIRDNLVLHTIKSADGKYVNKGAFLSEEFVDDERWRTALEGSNDESRTN